MGARALTPPELLDEVTALVEWPVVYVGEFEPEFLEVPQECLILTMQQNQKYFPLLDASGKLRNQFLIVSNMQVDDPKHIVGGNARVVRPRLSDLFACGECSRTGLHGANRLASNSLLEALVYSNTIYHYLAENPLLLPKIDAAIPEWPVSSKTKVTSEYVAQMKAKLQFLMRQNAGIVRVDSNLLKAKKKLRIMQNEIKEIIKNHLETSVLYNPTNFNFTKYKNLETSNFIDYSKNQSNKINPICKLLHIYLFTIFSSKAYRFFTPQQFAAHIP